MSILSLGLYAEGATDYDFLPPVIQRTAERVMAEAGKIEVVADVRIVKLMGDQQRKRDESILHAARDACNYHALIVHADADGPTAKNAWDERFYPGYLLVQQTNEQICKHLLPVIPIQATEAWILADYKALLEEIGTDLRPHDLGIPERARQVEAISRPKERLKEAIRRAYAERSKHQRRTDLSFLYQPLGTTISLDRLNSVPSYRRFKGDLARILMDLNIIQVDRW